MDISRTVIFDLGGVIVDLDVSRTLYAFAALSGFSLEQVESKYVNDPLFVDFETGIISAPEFRQGVKYLFDSNEVTDAEIDRAWNAMLLGISREKLEFMAGLKRHYRVMILSNTNVIHIAHLQNELLPKSAGVRSFDPFVHKTYFSSSLRLRKPDPEIFRRVLAADNLMPAETIFLDDNAENIEAAQALGIQARFVSHPEKVFDLVR